jgi:hypothetical protein
MNQLPIYKTLKAQQAIVDVLGDRIYEDIAPEGTKTPYLVWSDLSGEPNTSIDNITNEDDVSYQVMIYDPYQKVASDIRSKVSDVLTNHSYIDIRIGHYETSTKLFARGFTGNWWVNR